MPLAPSKKLPACLVPLILPALYPCYRRPLAPVPPCSYSCSSVLSPLLPLFLSLLPLFIPLLLMFLRAFYLCSFPLLLHASYPCPSLLSIPVPLWFLSLFLPAFLHPVPLRCLPLFLAASYPRWKGPAWLLPLVEKVLCLAPTSVKSVLINSGLVVGIGAGTEYLKDRTKEKEKIAKIEQEKEEKAYEEIGLALADNEVDMSPLLKV